MSNAGATTDRILSERFLRDYPAEAARTIERDGADMTRALAIYPPSILAPVWERLSPFMALRLLAELPADLGATLLAELRPAAAAELLGRMAPAGREAWLERLPRAIRRELSELLEYPADSAGRLMSRRLGFFRGDMTVAEASTRLRELGGHDAHSLFLVDDDLRLTGRVSIQAFALAPLEARLEALSEPAHTRADALGPRAELVELLDRHRLIDLPVVDAEGRLIGVVSETELLAAVQTDAASDLQAMVGASRDERALSPTAFVVGKRLPWLQINLLTAFLAAAVVGLFEHTIAQFTALAVLLPVVAGQSGNAGAQALAVTMRGLALREITIRHTLPVVLKELRVGLFNGLAVAVTTAAGVYLWSQSWGLALVIALSMVLSMVAAGFAGALVPITLRRLGQDPATSSSIILTTVTDVAGFFSFLGIATLLSFLL